MIKMTMQEVPFIYRHMVELTAPSITHSSFNVSSARYFCLLKHVYVGR